MDSSHHGHGNDFVNATWHDHQPFQQSHGQSPVQEYNGFNFAQSNQSSGPEPAYTHIDTSIHSTPQQLRPLVVPPWPSMLTSQSTYTPPVAPTAPTLTPIMSTPVSSTSTRSTHSTQSTPATSGPRRTLTDSDRKRMCLYHEENPTVKQTEIGAMFGVERSTVSKVLRQKEKYLFPDDGSRSPIKRAKGKFPDIERALANWARNTQRTGLPVSDSMIKEKARFFATTVGNSDSHAKINSGTWLEKFKQKNNLAGAKSSKKSREATEAEGGAIAETSSASHTPSGISPTSPGGVLSPSPMSATKSQDGLKTESPDSYMDFSGFKLSNSHSATSLSSVFTDTAPSSYSADPHSPPSPFFTPDSAGGHNPFLQAQQGRMCSPNGSYGRPRSQTFPLLAVDPAYISPPQSSEPPTPKYVDQTTAGVSGQDSAMAEMPPPLRMGEMLSPASSVAPASNGHKASSPASSMLPPPAVSHSPTQDDARRALELVMTFFQRQPSGLVDPQEYMTIGKLMEKLRQHSHQSLPGGLHQIPEQEVLAPAQPKVDQSLSAGP
ncbi:MAG: hypothetical protein M1825_006479 [Sarcosagium campestre]|nr:MAG: hypothetical protein M1825_006479 [Sarcosagium campestre]